MAKTSVFAPDYVTITLEKEHRPDEFYQNRQGLWVSDSFKQLVVVKAQPTGAGMSFKLKLRPLGRNAIDREIEEELEEMLGKGKHLFDETQVSVMFACLIEGQPNGEGGPLLNNGYANLCYLPSSVVLVSWHSGHHEWHVSTWERDDIRWDAGSQVFSLGN